MIAKENCALRCLSPACYELVYEGDPVREIMVECYLVSVRSLVLYGFCNLSYALCNCMYRLISWKKERKMFSGAKSTNIVCTSKLHRL